MSSEENYRPDTPYVGLVPYSEEDAQFFFGREAEQEMISANLMASRLTLLYGASGVGKSSVLRAGVVKHLHQLVQQSLPERSSPEFIVAVFNSWRDDPVAGLISCVEEAVTQSLDGQAVGPVTPSPSLVHTLQEWTALADSDLLIILDQFEEYFLYHPDEDSEGTFAVEFPRAVNSRDLRVNFLISLREDALAKLDRFKGRIPNLFDNYLRIDHLNRKAARMAIKGPVERYNALHNTNIQVEEELVDAVLDQVRTGQVVLGEAGQGIVKTSASSTQTEALIETPYLQLVLTRLWNEEMQAGSSFLQLATLDRLGGARTIVKTHLDDVVMNLSDEERETSASMFRFLVTQSGTKIAHTSPDLAGYVGLKDAQVSPILEKLASPGVRILRPIAPPPESDQLNTPRYEIFHDVLGLK